MGTLGLVPSFDGAEFDAFDVVSAVACVAYRLSTLTDRLADVRFAVAEPQHADPADGVQRRKHGR